MRTGGITFLSVLLLAGCGSGQSPVSQSAAVKSALASVVTLEQERARQVSMPAVDGFTVAGVRQAKKTASVPCPQGNGSTHTPTPRARGIGPDIRRPPGH